MATALSDILRKLGHHQENLQLLSQVTSEAGARGGATWAWLRLGVHHLAVDQPGLAVVSLQAALRYDSTLHIYLQLQYLTYLPFRPDTLNIN